MTHWLRRILILLFVLVWLVLLLTPALAFYLAGNGQIQIGQADGRHWRLFLIQESHVEGVGLERSRSVGPPIDATGQVSCLKTTIDYWMWAGEGQSTEYCQCMDSATGDLVDVVPPACMTP